MTKVGGVVVITQVIHQDQASIPLQTSPQATPTSTPAAPPARRLLAPAQAKLDELSVAFLQGWPQALGVSSSESQLPADGPLMDLLCCRWSRSSWGFCVLPLACEPPSRRS